MVGAVGAVWVLLWWGTLRQADIDSTPAKEADARPELPPIPASLYVRRFVALMILVVATNMTWHGLRAWGPLFLKERHDFTSAGIQTFFMGYYAFSDVGALAAGGLTLVAAWYLPVHTSRVLVYLGFALIATLTALLPYLHGTALIVVFLIVGFAALGVFPNYYSFTQDLTQRHQGKLTGTLSCVCWVALAVWQYAIGSYVDATGAYHVPLIICGFAPLVGFVAIVILWGPAGDAKPAVAPPQPAAPEGAFTPATDTPGVPGITPSAR
jgi:ACS family hexuronate transporter-like MFS transporter